MKYFIAIAFAWVISLVLAATTILDTVSFDHLFVVWMIPVMFVLFLVMIGSREDSLK